MGPRIPLAIHQVIAGGFFLGSLFNPTDVAFLIRSPFYKEDSAQPHRQSGAMVNDQSRSEIPGRYRTRPGKTYVTTFLTTTPPPLRIFVESFVDSPVILSDSRHPHARIPRHPLMLFRTPLQWFAALCSTLHRFCGYADRTPSTLDSALFNLPLNQLTTSGQI
jgi:hypothetical protein